jgi:orotidine-5'-phosphate decarboxylase
MAHVSAQAIVALDVPTTAAALDIVDVLGDSCRFYKVGSELFTRGGPGIVRAIRERRCDVFLDLKFHDIPNTVRQAASAAANLGVRLLTVHASGGRAMLDAAVAGAGAECGVLAVTVLTSLDSSGLGEIWGRPALSVSDEVLRLAKLAESAGAHGIVCSGQEAARVRDRHANSLRTLVPGVRLEGGATHDQARVVTPRQAVEAGASYIILGRAVTAAPHPVAAMAEVNAALR